MLKTILNKVDLHLKNSNGPHIAAFDADGTLWSNDVGENFFQYQIDTCCLPELIAIDAWKHYLLLKKQSPPSAYLWLAQICHEQTLPTVESWALKAAEKYPPLLFQQQKLLITELQKRHILIFVVSASVQWAVAGALKYVGLDNITALGVKTKIINTVITREQDGFITWRKGKHDELIKATHGIRPMLSCGNSLGDQHLIEMSQNIKIAVQSQKANSKHVSLYQDEQDLLKLAQQNNWLSFDLS